MAVRIEGPFHQIVILQTTGITVVQMLRLRVQVLFLLLIYHVVRTIRVAILLRIPRGDGPDSCLMQTAKDPVSYSKE